MFQQNISDINILIFSINNGFRSSCFIICIFLFFFSFRTGYFSFFNFEWIFLFNSLFSVLNDIWRILPYSIRNTDIHSIAMSLVWLFVCFFFFCEHFDCDHLNVYIWLKGVILLSGCRFSLLTLCNSKIFDPHVHFVWHAILEYSNVNFNGLKWIIYSIEWPKPSENFFGKLWIDGESVQEIERNKLYFTTAAQNFLELFK